MVCPTRRPGKSGTTGTAAVLTRRRSPALAPADGHGRFDMTGTRATGGCPSNTGGPPSHCRSPLAADELALALLDPASGVSGSTFGSVAEIVRSHRRQPECPRGDWGLETHEGPGAPTFGSLQGAVRGIRGFPWVNPGIDSLQISRFRPWRVESLLGHGRLRPPSSTGRMGLRQRGIGASHMPSGRRSAPSGTRTSVP